MRGIIKNTTILLLYTISLFILLELIFNYSAFYILFPIKNMTSYGYIEKKTGEIVIPLNKYSKRQYAQLALPFEYVSHKISSKKLNKYFDEKTGLYGYSTTKNKIVILPKFDNAQNFDKGIAIVGLKTQNEIKYGTIDKKGKWLIQPKYNHLCPFKKYYTRACIDDKHCGIIDKFDNKITKMTYELNKIQCENSNIKENFCTFSLTR